jgi:hypothetical protein
MNCFVKNDMNFEYVNSNGDCTSYAPVSSNSLQRIIFDQNAFIGLEFSLVAGVEQVFVEDVRPGRDLRVFVVVNERDADTRAKIYEREKAIMDEMPALDFDFAIIARQGRTLEDIGTPAGTVALKR